VVASFDGGRISSDGGVLLLGQTDRRLGLLDRFAECFDDHRAPEWVEHSVEELLRQRVFGLALGYEDLNDHDELRRDALLATCVGKSDPTGESRSRERDRGSALAGKSTLNRLEWGLAESAADDRYRRVAVDTDAVDRFFVDVFLDSYDEPPEEIILDFDATDDPLHGHQEGRFFHDGMDFSRDSLRHQCARVAFGISVPIGRKEESRAANHRRRHCQERLRGRRLCPPGASG
jgi:hypothetical protein